MTALTSFVIALCAILAMFWMLHIYELGQRIESLQNSVQALETRFEVEARPLFINKYGSIYLNGEELWTDPE